MGATIFMVMEMSREYVLQRMALAARSLARELPEEPPRYIEFESVEAGSPLPASGPLGGVTPNEAERPEQVPGSYG